MARVRIDTGQLRRVVRDASRRELETAGRLVVNRAKVLAPVDTGRLRASIRSRTSRSFTLRPRLEVFTDVQYAVYVHDGTRAHIIRPRNARVLRFTVGGQVVYARVVHHPGTRPRPFLDRALREICGPRGYRIGER